MSEERCDVIIVGGGLSGLTAAYTLAEEGLDVILIERGGTCGCKNVTGGRLYGHSMEKVIPGFAQKAPVERMIVKERVAMLTEDGATAIDYTSPKLRTAPSYSVIRARFDKWLADQAEEAGAMIITGIRVDDLLLRDGKVCGVRCGADEAYADAVLLADGVNSLLAQKLGMKEELQPHQVAVGVKEVIALDEDTINQRFGLSKNEGTAMLCVGDMTGGGIGGGFLYTNKSSVSVGIVATLGDIGHTQLSVPDMVDRFKEHPIIRPLIDGGKTVEYSAHLVPEGGLKMVPKLYGDGVLLAGDAAGFVLNLGFTVRGMDLAIESGRLAAEAILEAGRKGDFSAQGLSGYQDALEESFVLRDMKRCKEFPAFMSSSHRLFEDYAPLMDDLLSALYVVDGDTSVGSLEKLTRGIRQVGLVNLGMDGIRGLRGLGVL